VTGRILTLMGADGAGKTWQARRLVSSVDMPATYIYAGSNPSAATYSLPSTRAWVRLKRAIGRPEHNSGPPEPGPVSRPAGAARRVTKHLKSLFTLALRASEDLYRLLLAEWLARRGHLVVLDRHPFADYYMRRVGRDAGWLRLGDRLHALLLQRVYPAPRHVVLLDAPPEVLHARKREGTLAAVDARCREYREMIHAFPRDTRVTVIDAGRPFEEVAAALLQIANGARPRGPVSKASTRRPSSACAEPPTTAV
jgi:thymidylate kinase